MTTCDHHGRSDDLKAHTRPAPRPPAGAILTILGFAQLLTVLDTFVINVALPTIGRDLSMSSTGIEWAISSYALAFGALLPLGGRLADALGARRAMMIAVVGFALSSAAAGASITGPMFIAARCVQGAFAAMLGPSSQAMVAVSYPDPTQRSRAFGIFGAIGALGGALGMALGGTITDYLSWRWTMYINVVFGALIIAGMVAWTRRTDLAVPRTRIKLLGTALMTAALLAVIYSFSLAGDDGWTDPWTLTALIGGIVLMVAFFRVQRHTSDPLMPTAIFHHRDRVAAFVVQFVIGGTSVAEFVFLNFYLQDVAHYSAATAGLAYVPAMLIQVTVTAVVLRWTITHLGARTIISGGIAIVGAGLLILTRLSPEQSYFSCAFVGIAVIGVGFGLVFSVIAHVVVTDAPSSMVGISAATGMSINKIGTSAAAPLLGTVVAAVAVGSSTGSGYIATFYVAAAACGLAAVTGMTLFRGGALVTPDGSERTVAEGR